MVRGPVEEGDQDVGPILAVGEPWPVWRGRPLPCLAVIDLAVVAATGVDLGLGLPADGTLSFFYDFAGDAWGLDPEDRGGWRVVHTPVDAPRAPSPIDQRPVLSSFVEGRICWTVPHLEEPASWALWESDRDGFRALCDAHPGLVYPPLGNRIGGWPALLQGPLQRRCQLAANGHPTGRRCASRPEVAELLEGAIGWRLLAQFGSDDPRDLAWSDGAVLTFMIHEDALATGDLTDVWMIRQCD